VDGETLAALATSAILIIGCNRCHLDIADSCLFTEVKLKISTAIFGFLTTIAESIAHLERLCQHLQANIS
jgi:hypothetical protein